VAGEAHVALAAVARERVALVEPELPLLLGGDQLEHVVLLDVAEPLARLELRLIGMIRRAGAPDSIGAADRRPALAVFVFNRRWWQDLL
jgi:hypothetical protein